LLCVGQEFQHVKKPDTVFIADSCSHDWLFQKKWLLLSMEALAQLLPVLRAGVPSIIVPFADQPGTKTS